MAVYARTMSETNTNGQEISNLKKNLVRALKQDITERQRTVLLLYYVKRMSMTEIGQQLGIHPSTVSRTIMRGEERLKRCMRYGAKTLLDDLK